MKYIFSILISLYNIYKIFKAKVDLLFLNGIIYLKIKNKFFLKNKKKLFLTNLAQAAIQLLINWSMATA
jgi:hypothetical protein